MRDELRYYELGYFRKIHSFQGPSVGSKAIYRLLRKSYVLYSGSLLRCATGCA